MLIFVYKFQSKHVFATLYPTVMTMPNYQSDYLLFCSCDDTGFKSKNIKTFMHPNRPFYLLMLHAV